MTLTLLTFVHNDWVSLGRLLDLLNDAFSSSRDRLSVVVVNDGSFESRPADLIGKELGCIRHIQVINLRGNIGHQRAIAVGLCHIQNEMPCDAVLVMDGDGEDDPQDARRLAASLESNQFNKIIFAERKRRSEGALFTFFYTLYRMTHFLLTGKGIRVGNFSIIPRRLLDHVTIDPNLWNHYAAAVYKSRIPRTTIPTERAKRLAGSSKLNFTGLVVHGLSAIACYSEIVVVRLLLVTLGLAALSGLGIGTALFVRMFTNYAIPGWTTSMVGFLSVALLQTLILLCVFVFYLLGNRNAKHFIPIQDYPAYISCVDILK